MPKEAYVLVVDDDPMIVQLVSATLEGAGYCVTTASDAWQEVVQTQGLKIGLVITDIQMPGGQTGADAVKRLRSLPNVSPLLPVIFLSGMEPEEARKIIPWDSKIRFLSKPINFEKLRSAIKDLTGLDRPL
jgi:two-component system OmpR family response regulator